MQHVLPSERDEFETRVGVTYCRRCGRPVVNDLYPDKEPKPCSDVKVTLRDDIGATAADTFETIGRPLVRLYDWLANRKV